MSFFSLKINFRPITSIWNTFSPTLCTGLFGHLFFLLFYTGAMIYVHLCNAPYPCHTYSSGLFEYWRLLDNKILHFYHEGNVNSYSRGLLLLFQLVCFRPLKNRTFWILIYRYFFFFLTGGIFIQNDLLMSKCYIKVLKISKIYNFLSQS